MSLRENSPQVFKLMDILDDTEVVEAMRKYFIDSDESDEMIQGFFKYWSTEEFKNRLCIAYLEVYTPDEIDLLVDMMSHPGYEIFRNKGLDFAFRQQAIATTYAQSILEKMKA